MKKFIQFAFATLLTFSLTTLEAGNPDRQGEAGAAELLLNPWARSAGFHSMNTSCVFGVEAMRTNVAGIGRIEKRELLVGYTRLYDGSTLGINSVGYAQKAGTNGAWAISLVSVDFGQIPITTNNQPEGTGGSYSPGFFHLGIGYTHTYDNKISVGLLLRTISESLPTVSAFGVAIDAGVQYVSGEQDNFRLGISLKNVGTPMTFGGEGLSTTNTFNPETGTDLKFETRAQKFELPSVLNIGLSYDFFFGSDLLLRTLTNFTSNAFSRDNVGVGAELSYRRKFSIRAAYKQEVGNALNSGENIYSGLSGGVSMDIPLKKSGAKKIGIDYAYRATNVFRGSHNFNLRFLF